LATLSPLTPGFGTDHQFKQHPDVAKFTPGAAEKNIALKDSVRQALGALKCHWRYEGNGESYVLPYNIGCVTLGLIAFVYY